MVSVENESIILKDLSNPLELIVSHLNNDVSHTVLCSEVPLLCKSEECIVGIDEAGRGPVLGPMVYGICYCSKNQQNILQTLRCADSKTLTEEKREDIFKLMCQEPDNLGWCVDVISPKQISNCMLRRQKYSLNEISHGSAIELIKLIKSNGVNVSEVYIDTVGPPEKYEEKLSKIFPQIMIKVSKKADALFPVVSAASICAKVVRDLALKNWKFSESIQLEENVWGSGYPNDPLTKKFLSDNLDPIFGFPQIVRFSWSTAANILQEKAAPVAWSDDEDVENGNNSIVSYFKQNKLKRHSFFTNRNLESVDSLL